MFSASPSERLHFLRSRIASRDPAISGQKLVEQRHNGWTMVPWHVSEPSRLGHASRTAAPSFPHASQSESFGVFWFQTSTSSLFALVLPPHNSSRLRHLLPAANTPSPPVPLGQVGEAAGPFPETRPSSGLRPSGSHCLPCSAQPSPKSRGSSSVPGMGWGRCSGHEGATVAVDGWEGLPLWGPR